MKKRTSGPSRINELSLFIVRFMSFEFCKKEMSLIDLIFSLFLLSSSPNKFCVIWLFFWTSKSVNSFFSEGNFLLKLSIESKWPRFTDLKAEAKDLLRKEFGTCEFRSWIILASVKIFWYFWRFWSWGLVDSYELRVFWRESNKGNLNEGRNVGTFKGWGVGDFF